MTLPIIMLAGTMGVGKDTVARIFKDRFRFKIASQADPIKQLAKKFFDFTEDELWGPSASRNVVVPFSDLSWRANQAAVQQGNTLPMASMAAIDTRTGGYVPVFTNIPMAADKLAEAIQELGKGGPGIDEHRSLLVAKKFFGQLAAFNADRGGLSARIVLQLLGTEVGRELDQMIWTRATLKKANDLLDTGAPGVVITDGRFKSEVLAAKRAGAKVVSVVDPDATAPAGTHSSETEILTVPTHFFDAVIENNKEAGIEQLARDIDSLFYYLFPTATLKSMQIGDDDDANRGWQYFIERNDFE